MVLVPLLFVVVACWVIALVVSYIVAKRGNSQPSLVNVSEAKYYLVAGQTEHEITPEQAKHAQKQGYTVILK